MIAMEGQGVIVGTTYSKRGPAGWPIDSSAVLDSSGVAEMAGAILDNRWGDYVAICAPQNGDAAFALRAPCGLLPCFVLPEDGFVVVASDTEIMLEAGFCLDTDWDYLASHLLAPNLRPAWTAYRHVIELCPGTFISADPPHRPGSVWNPWSFAQPSEQIADLDESVDLLRHEVLDSVAHHAHGHRHILLGLSGGLDSSIVAAALRRCGSHFTCVNFVSGPASGDERYYASAMARAVEAPLLELADDVSRINLLHSTSRHLPRPNARAFAQSNDRLTAELARNLEADAHFTGGGGDNVFCSLQSASPVADRIIAYGPGIAAIRTAADLSAITETGMGKVLRKALRRAWLASRAYQWPLEKSLLTPEAIKRGSALIDHPWLDAPSNALPGKAAHIAWLLGIQNHLDGFDREQTVALHHPLMSQPVVEACLRIPTWHWCHGGINRAVARLAFRPELPPEIYDRASKGSPFRLMIEAANANLDLIGDTLRNGQLARQGLLDTPRLDPALGHATNGQEAACARLLTLMDVEAWLMSQAEVAKPKAWDRPT